MSRVEDHFAATLNNNDKLLEDVKSMMLSKSNINTNKNNNNEIEIELQQEREELEILSRSSK